MDMKELLGSSAIVGGGERERCWVDRMARSAGHRAAAQEREPAAWAALTGSGEGR
ncbi:hypothetical protein HMPREF9057_00275 [Actinomyces sp. oral taxon 171 str. F0337]|nr:hypothetical protein HMPREF9057_00275 [Actinomyces sp. oral taxon 171 str. F0337]